MIIRFLEIIWKVFDFEIFMGIEVYLVLIFLVFIRKLLNDFYKVLIEKIREMFKLILVFYFNCNLSNIVWI